MSATLLVTNAQSGTYQSIMAADSGDPVPEGLAQALYDALSPVQFEGQISLVESEVSGAIGIGQVLNIAGGRPEWATMRALIQQVSEDWETGTTTVIFGPAEHLGAQDLIELLRVNRQRFIYTAPSTRDTGQASGQVVKMGTKFAGANSSTGGGVDRMKRIQNNQDFIEFDARTKRILIHEERTWGTIFDGFNLTLGRDGLSLVTTGGGEIHLGWHPAYDKAVMGMFRVTLQTPDGPKDFLLFGTDELV